MNKTTKPLNLPVSFLKEGHKFVAYSPALDLSTSGNSFEEAKKNFTEAVGIFFDELAKMATLDEVLLGLGWIKKDKDIIPPLVISQEIESLNIPLYK